MGSALTPINICCFESVRDKKPKLKLLNGIDQLVEFFTTNDPLVVEKDQRRNLFSMVTYKTGTTRGKANVESISGVVLDFDNKDIEWHPISEIVERLKPQKVAYLHYTTWSHTADHPKWRLIIPFNKPVSVEAWPDIYVRVLEMLGNPDGIDQAASKDAAHIWFMPYKQLGQPYDIGYRLTDTFLNPDALPPVPAAVPVSKEESVVSYEQASSSSYDNYPPTTLDDVSEVFISISPNMAYNSWLEMGMALKTHFGESAFPAWDQWSSSGTTYEGIAALQEKWASFKGTGINIGTFFHHAKAAGYVRNPSSRPYVSHASVAIASVKKTSKDPLTEEIEEEIEEVEPDDDLIEKCLADLKHFVVREIYDFPCTILQGTFDYIQSIATRPQPLFSLSSTVSSIGFLKRDAVMSDTRLRTNSYTLVIGASRTGKDNGLAYISEICAELSLAEYVARGIGSGQAIMQHLSEKKSTLYWIQDEIGRAFQTFKHKNAASHLSTLEHNILSLHRARYASTDLIKKEKLAHISNPFFHIYGVDTDNIFNHLSPNDINSGFLTRFWIFQLDRKEDLPKRNKNTNNPLPQELLEAYRTLNDQKDHKIAIYEPAARELLDTFLARVDHHQNIFYRKNNKIDSLIGNIGEHLVKFALLPTKTSLFPSGTPTLSVEYQAHPVITIASMEWAIAMAMHDFETKLNVAALLSDSPNEEFVNKIMNRFEQAKGKWVTRRDLSQSVNYKLLSYQVEQLLIDHVATKEVQRQESKRGGGILYRLNPNHPNFLKRKNK